MDRTQRHEILRKLLGHQAPVFELIRGKMLKVEDDFAFAFDTLVEYIIEEFDKGMTPLLAATVMTEAYECFKPQMLKERYPNDN